jgi:hypothetical protein
MFPRPPDAKPDMTGIDEETARLIDGVERGIRMKSFGLPTRVKALVRHLRELDIRTVPHTGKVFSSTDEAEKMRTDLVARLDEWFAKSQQSETGDSDTDRAELELIIADVKRLFRNVNWDGLYEKEDQPDEAVD